NYILLGKRQRSDAERSLWQRKRSPCLGLTIIYLAGSYAYFFRKDQLKMAYGQSRLIKQGRRIVFPMVIHIGSAHVDASTILRFHIGHGSQQTISCEDTFINGFSQFLHLKN